MHGLETIKAINAAATHECVDCGRTRHYLQSHGSFLSQVANELVCRDDLAKRAERSAQAKPVEVKS